MILQTERLYLREFTHSDLPFLAKLHSDGKVMRYIGPLRTMAESIDAIERIGQYYTASPGYGVWLASIQDSSIPIGWACLKDLDGTRSKEIGYRLLTPFWGKGYATELSMKLIQYGFIKKRLKKIVGITHPQNVGSQRVLEKAGLQYVKDAFYYNCNVRYYHLYRANWITKQQLAG